MYIKKQINLDDKRFDFYLDIPKQKNDAAWMQVHYSRLQISTFQMKIPVYIET